MQCGADALLLPLSQVRKHGQTDDLSGDRMATFFVDDDKRYFLAKLAELASAESVAGHADVLMTNHIHLLMTSNTDEGVSRLMKGLGQRYVQNINRRYGRTGTLFEGRFRWHPSPPDESPLQKEV